MEHTSIWIIDVNPETGTGHALEQLLSATPGMETSYDCGESARRRHLEIKLSAMGTRTPDVCFLLARESSRSEVPQLVRTITQRTRTPIIGVLESGAPAEVDDLLNSGASDFVVAPLEPVNVLPRIARLLKQRQTSNESANRLKEELGLRGFVGESPRLLDEIRKIPAVGSCDASALIIGESGTGKELCARAIHYLSPRAKEAFIAVNCGAIPGELVENELFGHEAGAFSGAGGPSEGLIHEAQGGTLFLDEIDGLPLLSQVKLLRFLQEKEYRRLGARKVCKANVRIVAATNCNFKDALRLGRFRQDLYYRLNTVSLTMPPLRERPDDIPLLAHHFMKKSTLEFKKAITDFCPSAIQKLVAYDWPGNVRELENVITRSVLLAEKNPIAAAAILLPETCSVNNGSLKDLKAVLIAQFEQRYITQLLTIYDGNISQAARAAHKHRRAFWQLMRKYQIRANSHLYSSSF